jgi:hypothetical protein
MMIQHDEYPFRHTIIDDYLSQSAYKQFCRHAEDLVSHTTVRAFNDYDAKAYPLSGNHTILLKHILTKNFFDINRNYYASKYTNCIDAAVHIHRPGSRAGWRHNDFNFGHFLRSESTDLIYSNNEICDYRRGTINEKGQEAIRLVRSLACLFYFDNSWHEGDGGETLVSMHEQCEGCKYDKLIAPVDNRLFMFECSPFSFHAFQGAAKFRKSLIFWLHSSVYEVSQKWPITEVVPWG